MKTIVRIYFLKETEYTGRQLSRKWIRAISRSRNVIIVFSGKCDIKPEFMVDKEDLKNNREIKSDKMVHFIIKIVGLKLPFIVYVQRFFIAYIKEYIEKHKNVRLERKGDDLFYKERKLTISVATCARKRNEGYIHTGVNITNKGTPKDVKTASLEDLNIPYKKFAREIAKGFGKEIIDIFNDAKKVKNA